MLIPLLFADVPPIPVMILFFFGWPIIGGALIIYAVFLVGRSIRKQNRQLREEQETESEE